MLAWYVLWTCVSVCVSHELFSIIPAKLFIAQTMIALWCCCVYFRLMRLCVKLMLSLRLWDKMKILSTPSPLLSRFMNIHTEPERSDASSG